MPLRYTSRLMMTTLMVPFGKRADGSGVNLDGSIALGMVEMFSGGSVARTTRFSRHVLLTQMAWSTLHMVNFISLFRWMLVGEGGGGGGKEICVALLWALRWF